MNEILQNRVLRGFLTLFVGVMLALSIGLAMKSAYPAPPTYFDWYSHGGNAWEQQNPSPQGDYDTPTWDKWNDRRTAAEAQARKVWERDNHIVKFKTWALVTFLLLFGVGLVLAVGSTIWQEQLAVLSGGIFLAGVIAIADAAVLNIDGLAALGGADPWTRYIGWLLVLMALAASVALMTLGWWRFRSENQNRDGQVAYSILAAVLPVWFVGVAVTRTLEALRTPDATNPAIWFCLAFFTTSVVLLTVGMLFSRQLGLLGNVMSLSAVIMAFASVIASLGLESLGATAAIALAATVVAMLVGYRAFATRAEKVESVAVQQGGMGTVAAAASGDTVLVLYASGEAPPSDAKLVEVDLGNGITYRGFAAQRAKPTNPPGGAGTE